MPKSHILKETPSAPDFARFSEISGGYVWQARLAINGSLANTERENLE
jgi:hypothetical protein